MLDQNRGNAWINLTTTDEAGSSGVAPAWEKAASDSVLPRLDPAPGHGQLAVPLQRWVLLTSIFAAEGRGLSVRTRRVVRPVRLGANVGLLASGASVHGRAR